MSSQFLFNRAWAVSIAAPSDTFSKTYDTLRVTFDITKNTLSTSNKSKIEIYNLDVSSRTQFVKGSTIRLQAGYQGLVETLFIGNITTVKSSRKGPDIITSFESGDGEKQLINAHFDKSYKPGTTYVQIIQDLAAALSVNIGIVIGVENLVYNSGISLSGSVKSALDKLLLKTGLEWSIQNNSLQVNPVNAHNGDTVIVLASASTKGQQSNPTVDQVMQQNTGLIGIPTQANGRTYFTALLNPKLIPGTPVQIISETINGVFKINQAHIEGDSHGDKWQASCESIPIGANQTFPQNQGDTFITVD